MSIYNTAVNKPISTLMVFIAHYGIRCCLLYTVAGGPIP